MKSNIHNCPICNKELRTFARYPNYLCPQCAAKAKDKDGRELVFGNISMSGGFLAVYKDTNDTYDSHLCYVDGIECFADEARFGGIVIEKK